MAYHNATNLTLNSTNNGQDNNQKSLCMNATDRYSEYNINI